MRKYWKRLFWFCLGLAIAAGFCMKWMEPDLWSRNERFTIMGLELWYDKSTVQRILTGLDARVKTILQYHLYFDFAFMCGIYPAITAAAMICRDRLTTTASRNLLYFVALLPMVAWILDIVENYLLLTWLKNPVIDVSFVSYHIVVIIKWLTALVAGAVVIIMFVSKRNQRAL